MRQSREIGPQGRVDAWIWGAGALLIAISVLMVFSSTAIYSEELYGSSTALVRRHILHLTLGLVACITMLMLPAEVLRKLAVPGVLISAIVLFILALPGIGHSAGGATRWIGFGGFRFQPGEFVKLGVVLFFAYYIGRYQRIMHHFVPGVVGPALILGVFALLFLAQPDFGSTAVLCIVVGCQLLLGARLSHLFGVGMLGAGALDLAVFTSPYRMKRVQRFLDPFDDASGSGYQLIQSLVAVGSGGVSGVGLGAGRQKLFYLPAAHTDFIFAVVAEELGIIGAGFVILLFAILGYRGLMLTRRLSGDAFKSALALGCTLLIVIPAFLNVGVVLGVLPTKGMVLPFVAYGGSASIVYLSALGILLRLSREEAP